MKFKKLYALKALFESFICNTNVLMLIYMYKQKNSSLTLRFIITGNANQKLCAQKQMNRYLFISVYYLTVFQKFKDGLALSLYSNLKVKGEID